MKTLFMIPARSGSKGVKGKNVRNLCGKPLMWYAIDAVRRSKSFADGSSRVVVNTDSEEYAEIARKCDAEIPYLRAEELSRDDTPIAEVIADAYEKMSGEGFEAFALIQATSPLLKSSDVDAAITLIRDGADSVISVTESEVMPLWCNVLDDSLSMKGFVAPEIRALNRQELPVYYRVTGSMRVAKWDCFEKSGFDWYAGDSRALITTNESAVDIDTEEDFLYAEFLMKRRLGL